jgi:spermidine dehydrogenase
MADFTRRDIVHGALATPGLLALPRVGRGADDYYPPAKTGLRGSHPGSFEIAHALAREGKRDFGPAQRMDKTYDLVVVGGGVSGLSAAYFYRQKKADARILILDNHDDFGGHAKRNEFVVDGSTLVGYGGSQTMESPSAYSDVATSLLQQLSVDLDAFDQAFDQDFYVRHGLQGGLFFDRETYGRSAFVGVDVFGSSDFLGLAAAADSTADAVSRMPLGEADRMALLDLLTKSTDALPEVGLLDLPDYLSSISYQHYLTEHLGVTSEVLVNLLRLIPSGYFGIGIDGITALDALATGMPWGQKLGVPGLRWLRNLLGALADPYIHHYPDGNATIARLLVRSLIPEIAQDSAPADLVTNRFDYAQLDRNEHLVRIRLNSTVVNVSQTKGQVEVSYVQNGKAYRVATEHCVLACYNNIIPYIAPHLPAVQKQALALQVKVPLVYTNVALRNWKALKKLGIGQCFAPNMFHNMMMVDFPVSMGSYRYAQNSEQPVLLHLSSAFGAPGLHPRDQFRIGRAKLLGTTYAQIEADVLNFLQQLLGDGGFDVGKDIAGITVNRWPHGYAYGTYTLFDDYAAGQAPHELGRQTWGNVAIANSDAGARAYLDEAINQAHRAVAELH